MIKKLYSIRRLLEIEFDNFSHARSLPQHVLKTVQAILDCRTQVYGGNMYGCPDEHYSLVLFNSCKKRNCPTCQNTEIEYWNHVQKNRLLRTGHYHLVFKQPEMFHSEFLSNYSGYANLLFDSARDTLKEILPVSIKAGLIMQLHTHGHNNEIHPHVHCALTDGGMNEEGEYESFDESILDSSRLQETYRKQYLRKLRRRVKDGRICHAQSPAELSGILSDKLMPVFSSNRYDRGEWLITYFARHSRGGSIHDHQLRYIRDGKVGYWYRDGENNVIETELSTETFIQRFLYHIPPDRYNTVRYCGLYATGCVDEYQEMRAYLNQEAYVKPGRVNLVEKEKLCCPVCNRSLVYQESFERNSIPFLLLRKLRFKPELIQSRYWLAKGKIGGLKFLWSELLRAPPSVVSNRSN